MFANSAQMNSGIVAHLPNVVKFMIWYSNQHISSLQYILANMLQVLRTTITVWLSATPRLLDPHLWYILSQGPPLQPTRWRSSLTSPHSNSLASHVDLSYSPHRKFSRYLRCFVWSLTSVLQKAIPCTQPHQRHAPIPTNRFFDDVSPYLDVTIALLPPMCHAEGSGIKNMMARIFSRSPLPRTTLLTHARFPSWTSSKPKANM